MFGIKDEYKEDYMKMGESKVEKYLGLDYRVYNKLICFLEESYVASGNRALPQSPLKAFWRLTHERMRCSGKMYWSWSKHQRLCQVPGVSSTTR